MADEEVVVRRRKVSNQGLIDQQKSENNLRFEGIRHDNMTLAREDFKNMLQEVRRADLLNWLIQLFPDLTFPEPSNIEGFMNMFQDGTLLCRLANEITPQDQITKFHHSPKYDAQRRENIHLFLDSCKKIGLHEVQLFTPDDLLAGTTLSAVVTPLRRREERFSLTLLSLALLSNNIGQCRFKFVVNELVRADEDERRKTLRLGPQFALGSSESGNDSKTTGEDGLTTTSGEGGSESSAEGLTGGEASSASSLSSDPSGATNAETDASGTQFKTASELAKENETEKVFAMPKPVSSKMNKRLTLQRKEKAGHLSLAASARQNVGNNSQTQSQEGDFTEEQLEKSLETLAKQEKQDEEEKDRKEKEEKEAKEREEKLKENPSRKKSMPPKVIRTVSVKFGSEIRVNKSRLGTDANEKDVTLKFTGPVPFVVRDYIKIDDEVMKITGVLHDTIMVERGKNGTAPTAHAAGSVAEHVKGETDDKEFAYDYDKFEALRRRAIDEDFKDLDEMDFIQLMEDVSGNDDTNSATFVLIVSEHYLKEKNIVDGKHNDERLLAYLINRLDNIVHDNYSILYFHSANTSHQLEFGFLSKAYSVLSREYKHNLKNVWIIHPTVWVRLAHFFCAPFMDEGIANKVFVCESIESLYDYFDKDGLILPACVIKSEEEQKSSWF
eukprot:c18830_g1_i1.p1 GENE.c18830_g1_i1~~c18830_g1_i1.p1  ORF type:complete len:669 (+),score=304.10 c18830_g1_i1:45-2051(+)